MFISELFPNDLEEAIMTPGMLAWHREATPSTVSDTFSPVTAKYSNIINAKDEKAHDDWLASKGLGWATKEIRSNKIRYTFANNDSTSYDYSKDFTELKEEQVNENNHDINDKVGRQSRAKHFASLSPELQDLMRPRLAQDRGYWDSYYKAKKQLSRSKQVDETISSGEYKGTGDAASYYLRQAKRIQAEIDRAKGGHDSSLERKLNDFKQEYKRLSGKTAKDSEKVMDETMAAGDYLNPNWGKCKAVDGGWYVRKLYRNPLCVAGPFDSFEEAEFWFSENEEAVFSDDYDIKKYSADAHDFITELTDGLPD